MVVLTDEDLAELPLSTSRRIDVLQFTPLEQVDPIYFNKSYYLEPDAQGVKPYVLLRDALEDSDKVAVVKVALRQRESLGTLRVRDGVFVLETMLWPDEVREAEFPFLEEDVDVRPQELQMASSLIETMTSDFDPTEYKDTYREALEAIIEAKIQGREIVAPEAPEEAPAAADLLSALRASVEAAKKGRTDKGDGEARKAAGSAKAGSHARKDGAAKSGTAKADTAKSGTAKADTAKGGAKKTAGTKAKAKSGTRKTA
jgi:DNA end-binding protein Ku